MPVFDGNVTRGVVGILWLGGPDNRGAVGAENSTAEGTLGTPTQIFSSNMYKSQGSTQWCSGKILFGGC
jgi:hypothetical protein